MTREFTFTVPDGFVELPVEDIEVDGAEKHELDARVAAVFGLAADDPNAAMLANTYALYGETMGSQGIGYAAIAVYRSPDVPDRPIMPVLASSCIPSAHDSVDVAVEGLLEVHASVEGRTARLLDLPAGKAVVTVQEEKTILRNDADGIEIPVLQRQVAAWIPDPRGTSVAMVGVCSNNWQDWEHVVVLALDIFDTVSWVG
ncbi:hypothetical protein ATK30_0314 [Amycolatopsis echigonensis]|uniref:Uncharacterized protein n=1 Tax=Amycolatopsis echigonensis TaxID=2576905 RepID=A0A2N3X269_9PSEU|nr:hypothetical protein [Amycolatopsis niigatensis]PKW00224.1 hypothetical protein ATK30_0314 [Amycolatopsis niigatensis]